MTINGKIFHYTKATFQEIYDKIRAPLKTPVIEVSMKRKEGKDVRN